MPFPVEYRQHVGVCRCGARFGYDARSYEAAAGRARAHVEAGFAAAPGGPQ